MDKESISKNPDHESKKDNVSHAAIKKKYKTLDPVKRYGLDEQQAETYRWLKDKRLQTDDGTLCYWAKKYSQERLENIYRETCRRRPENFSAYMGSLLLNNATVREDAAEECAKFAEDFKASNGWFALKIGTNFVSFDLGRSKEEISLKQKPESFARQLIEKYNLIKNNRY
jgi:hypothetical protein